MAIQLFIIHMLGVFTGNHSIDYPLCQTLIIAFACLTLNPLAAAPYLLAFNAGRSGVAIPHWALLTFLLLMMCIERSGKTKTKELILK